MFSHILLKGHSSIAAVSKLNFRSTFRYFNSTRYEQSIKQNNSAFPTVLTVVQSLKTEIIRKSAKNPLRRISKRL